MGSWIPGTFCKPPPPHLKVPSSPRARIRGGFTFAEVFIAKRKLIYARLGAKRPIWRQDLGAQPRTPLFLRPKAPRGDKRMMLTHHPFMKVGRRRREIKREREREDKPRCMSFLREGLVTSTCNLLSCVSMLCKNGHSPPQSKSGFPFQKHYCASVDLKQIDREFKVRSKEKRGMNYCKQLLQVI